MATTIETQAAVAGESNLEASRTAPENAVSTKRKASQSSLAQDDEGSEGAKRLRADDDEERASAPDHPPAGNATSPAQAKVQSPEQPTNESRRSRPSQDEEKRRGKRLFGGLLSTLSQTAVSSQQRRRQEIERRQQDRVHKQRAEDDQKRAERLARITAVRRQEQVKFEEKVTKTRHSNLLARAHSLRTKAQPPIYYRPWKLTRAQEETINDQVEEARRAISRETGEPILPTSSHSKQPSRSSRPSTARSERPVPEGAESSSRALPDATNQSPSHTHRNGHDRDHHDESGDIVMDAEEDMVIY